jgi:hypothetical protein
MPTGKMTHKTKPNQNPTASFARAAMEFISLMAKGDASAVKSLLQHYVVVTPAIRDVLARLGPTPPLLRPVHRTANRLSPTDH